jgi:putative component of toxin-antitoxin plasmid stabilization module
VSLAAYVAENGLVGHHWEERLVKIICPNTGECQGQKVGVGGLRSSAGGGYRGLLG